MNERKFILASQSPRRRELLAQLGLPFEIIMSNVDETQHPGESPEIYATRLSQEKARAVAQKVNEPALIVAADTVVVESGEVLGKPENGAEAASMLRHLRGITHKVITAVTALGTESGKMVTEAPASLVTMRSYTDKEIAAYVATGDPMDKAGAYAIQHPDFHPVEALEGCYATVMGLPICRVARMLEQFGIEFSEGAVEACRNHIGHPCNLYDA